MLYYGGHGAYLITEAAPRAAEAPSLSEHTHPVAIIVVIIITDIYICLGKLTVSLLAVAAGPIDARRGRHVGATYIHIDCARTPPLSPSHRDPRASRGRRPSSLPGPQQVTSPRRCASRRGLGHRQKKYVDNNRKAFFLPWAGGGWSRATRIARASS